MCPRGSQQSPYVAPETKRLADRGETFHDLVMKTTKIHYVVRDEIAFRYCIQIGSVPHWAPMTKNCFPGPLLRINSFSSNVTSIKSLKLLNRTLICAHGTITCHLLVAWTSASNFVCLLKDLSINLFDSAYICQVQWQVTRWGERKPF